MPHKMPKNKPHIAIDCHHVSASDESQFSMNTLQSIPSTGSKVWIFQAVPKWYDLEKEVPKRRRKSARGDAWSVTRFRQLMDPKDRVLLWQSGPKAGIYGTGKLVSDPFKDAKDWRVKIRFDSLLKRPILKTELKKIRQLKRLRILRSSRGTNFKVTRQEWAYLQPLLGRRQSRTDEEISVLRSDIPVFDPKNIRDARTRIFMKLYDDRVRRQWH